MNSLNRAQIIGNLTRDPELRQTPNGQSVCTIGVATNRRWKDRNTGENQEQTEFHNVVCWGRLAEISSQYLAKGRRVYFEGRLQTRSWEGEDGKKNYRTEIIAENMIMLDARGGNSDPAPSSDQSSDSTPAPSEEEINVEDLPF